MAFLRSFVVLSCSLLAVASGVSDSCPNAAAAIATYGNYLGCLDKGLQTRHDDLDTELIEAQKTLVHCFAANVSDASASGLCPMAPRLLESNAAWGRNGPLRDCPICLNMAKSVITAFASGNSATAKCVRDELWPAVGRESAHCIRQKMPDFAGVPAIPDFELASFSNPRATLEALSLMIVQEMRLAECENKNPKFAEGTKACMADPHDDEYMTKHCETARGCIEASTPECRSKLAEVEPVTCQCLLGSSHVIRSRLDAVADTFKEIFEKRAEHNRRGAVTAIEIRSCVHSIKSNLRTPVNDWLQLIEAALPKCGIPIGDLSKPLGIFCKTVISQMSTDAGSHNVDTGFRFLGAFAQAMMSRAARFCHGNWCPMQA